MDIIYVHMLFWVDSTHRFSVGRQNTTFLFYFPSHLTFDSSVSVNLYKILIRQFQIKVTVDLESSERCPCLCQGVLVQCRVAHRYPPGGSFPIKFCVTCVMLARWNGRKTHLQSCRVKSLGRLCHIGLVHIGLSGSERPVKT
jgi:hypothetical protein